VKIDRNTPTRATRTAGNAPADPAGGARFRQLLENSLAPVQEQSEHRSSPGDKAQDTATLAHAIQMLDELLNRMEHEHAPTEHTRETLRDLRAALGRCLPEHARPDAETMIAVENERLKRPW